MQASPTTNDYLALSIHNWLSSDTACTYGWDSLSKQQEQHVTLHFFNFPQNELTTARIDHKLSAIHKLMRLSKT